MAAAPIVTCAPESTVVRERLCAFFLAGALLFASQHAQAVEEPDLSPDELGRVSVFSADVISAHFHEAGEWTKLNGLPTGQSVPVLSEYFERAATELYWSLNPVQQGTGLKSAVELAAAQGAVPALGGEPLKSALTVHGHQ